MCASADIEPPIMAPIEGTDSSVGKVVTTMEPSRFESRARYFHERATVSLAQMRFLVTWTGY